MDYKEKVIALLKSQELSKEQKEKLENIFPELKESEDEKIRKAIISFLKSPFVNESITDEKVIPWIAWLEKQGDTNKTINKDKFVQGVLRGAAINLINWIDYNAAEGNMCLSNMECKDIEDALVSGDWDKIFTYIKKKLEKQGEQKPNPCNGCINRKGCINCENGELREVEQKPADKVEPKFKVKYADSEYNVLEVKEIAGVTYYGIEDEPNHIDYVLPDNCEIVSEQKPTDIQSIEKRAYEVFPDDDDANTPFYRQAFIDGAVDYIDCGCKKSSAWGKEDEQMVDNIIDYMEPMPIFFESTEGKSGKEYTQKFVKNAINWLTSLRPQNRWKPSDEQMEALNTINVTGCITDIGQGRLLVELYQDLKKLRKE